MTTTATWGRFVPPQAAMRFLFIQNTEAFQAMPTAASLLSAPAAAGHPLAIHFVGRQDPAAATTAQNALGEKLKVNP